MLKVYKYIIDYDDYFDLELPRGAQVLTVNKQYNNLILWALVNPILPHIKRYFRLAGTGHPIKESINILDYINTFQLEDGALIFHVFEILPIENKQSTKRCSLCKGTGKAIIDRGDDVSEYYKD